MFVLGQHHHPALLPWLLLLLQPTHNRGTEQCLKPFQRRMPQHSHSTISTNDSTIFERSNDFHYQIQQNSYAKAGDIYARRSNLQHSLTTCNTGTSGIEPTATSPCVFSYTELSKHNEQNILPTRFFSFALIQDDPKLNHCTVQ